jgi:hypothetical protein
VTFILTINGRESIWLLADRRLSYPNFFKDTGRKLLSLETTDGEALIGYAGLGATARGTEPCDWMGNVLRGRNFTLEQSLGVLSAALRNQFPPHLIELPKENLPAHNIIVTAFIGNEVKAYTIDLVLTPDRKNYRFRYTRYVIPTTMKHTPPLTIGGSGALFLYKKRSWIRPLLHIVKAYESGQVSPYIVADHLAKLNNEVSLGIEDNSVSQNCIVTWKNRKKGVHKGGGGHQFYNNNRERIHGDSSIPLIVTGIDLNALINFMMPRITEDFDLLRKGETPEEWNKDEINKKLANLPHKPDEKLR